ncbi:mitochondrial fission ELM1 family protein [Phenylobacterium hankyongense]|uniref:mitochondrial fission ELM1 family protein n=1 Tax=Phenylobacterium hankyongense TaxID=1813876 RepID=UPI001FB2B8C6|nr:mitochondrial fission ELM1 family protein [Phenylobacterium hankyongense]
MNIWAVSDGRAGIEAQVDGLAQAVARLRPAEIVIKRIGWRWGLGRLPSRLNPGLLATLTPGSGLHPPWPDIWIAAGRATLPLSTRLRRLSGGRTFVVQTQHPRQPIKAFDLVVPPIHDRLTGANVLPIVGSPNRLSPAQLAAELERFRDKLESLPRPRVAVIVGGASKAFGLPAERAARMGREVAEAVTASGGSVLVSFTRRTPQAAREILRAEWARLPGVVWDDRGDNPYFAFLAAADAILVTEDSTNLATEAAATGKPVHVLALEGRSEKFDRFHHDLRERGSARPFAGRLESWDYTPLAETDRAAAELLRRYDARN